MKPTGDAWADSGLRRMVARSWSDWTLQNSPANFAENKDAPAWHGSNEESEDIDPAWDEDANEELEDDGPATFEKNTAVAEDVQWNEQLEKDAAAEWGVNDAACPWDGMQHEDFDTPAALAEDDAAGEECDRDAPCEEWAEDLAENDAADEEWEANAPCEEWADEAPCEEWAEDAPCEEWAEEAPCEEWPEEAPCEEWPKVAENDAADQEWEDDEAEEDPEQPCDPRLDLASRTNGWTDDSSSSFPDPDDIEWPEGSYFLVARPNSV